MFRATLCLVVLSVLAVGLADEAEDTRRFITMLELVMNNTPPGGSRMSVMMAKLCDRFPIQCSRIGEGTWTGSESDTSGLQWSPREVVTPPVKASKNLVKPDSTSLF
ncbi:hypothetical protein Bbelb_368160 [Branchiostoma belcheri]|nr:hypothetical protein Bbelb_368160 [Branchiostoma belcheri]